MVERYLHVGLRGDPLKTDVRGDLYGAFVQNAERRGAAWTRLDVSSPGSVQWGMNDAGISLGHPQIAWVQVTPTVGDHERFPLINVATSLSLAFSSLTDAPIKGVHVVTATEEFTQRSAPPLDTRPGPVDGPCATVVITVDAQTGAAAEQLASAILARPQANVGEILSANESLGRSDSQDSGMWRLYSDPARQGEVAPRRFEVVAIVGYDSFSDLPAVAEAVYFSLAELEAQGPASVAVDLGR